LQPFCNPTGCNWPSQGDTGRTAPQAKVLVRLDFASLAGTHRHAPGRVVLPVPGLDVVGVEAEGCGVGDEPAVDGGRAHPFGVLALDGIAEVEVDGPAALVGAGARAGDPQAGDLGVAVLGHRSV